MQNVFLGNFLIKDENLVDLETFCVRLIKLVCAVRRAAAVDRVQQTVDGTRLTACVKAVGGNFEHKL